MDELMQDVAPEAPLGAIPGLPDYTQRGGTISIIAGPCSVESREQFDVIAACIAEEGLSWVRGGAFKPRTNPHSFEGLGEEGLRIMADAGARYGLKVLTEVMDSAHCELVHEYADGLQIGARNCQNYSLLRTIGEVSAESKKLVFYKRGMATTISEWLSAVDYITDAGNDNVMLCERGMRTFENATRYTLDIAAVPVVHKQSFIPICVDVSHPAGVRDIVPSLAYAAIAAGADALMIEIHPNPAHAKSDAAQKLKLEQFRGLLSNLRELAASFGKTLV